MKTKREAYDLVRVCLDSYENNDQRTVAIINRLTAYGLNITDIVRAFAEKTK